MTWSTVLLAVGPSVVLLAYFWLRDRYDREPFGHVIGAFGLGVYAVLAVKGAFAMLEPLIPTGWPVGYGELARLADAFGLAAGAEELAKLVVLGAAVQLWEALDEPLDGLLYGVAVGLGFATLENLIYLSALDATRGWQRAIFAVPAHALFGGTMGYYLGRAKLEPRGPRRLHRALAFVLPVLFHGAYNYALARRLDWKVWGTITTLSFGLWMFVLERVRRAQRASPYRPRTIAPFARQDPTRRP